MTQNTQLLTLLGGVVVPIVVGILTKAQAPSGLKAIVNAALTALTSVLALVVPATFEWKAFFIAWATAWVISVATHFGLYKPTGVSAAVQSSTATLGLG
jgi:hypothetical protein